MSKNSRRAGSNIRELAFKRRNYAFACFFLAGISPFLPLILVKTYESIEQPLTILNQVEKVSIPLVVYGAFALVSVALVRQGTSFWKQANNADQGARGEEEIGQDLDFLTQEGWRFEYGARLGNRLGDADVICTSPQDKTYVIDVKSHKGEVVTDGHVLYRQVGKKKSTFEKDFLDKMVKQAIEVKKQKNIKFVTPILTFSQAKVSVPPGKLRDVYVVDRTRLLPLLRSLG